MFVDYTSQLKGCQLANTLLTKCCLLSNVARNQATRLLVELAVYPPVSPIFGAVVKPAIDINYNDMSLLKENIKQVSKVGRNSLGNLRAEFDAAIV